MFRADRAGRGLCTEAIRPARILATLMPDEPEVAGLPALLLLTESRTRWDRALIEEGQAIVRRCLRRNRPGAYQLQAAINAVRAAAALALVDELDLEDYYAFHATCADLLRRLGRDDEAASAYERAAVLAPTDAERDVLRLGGQAAR